MKKYLWHGMAPEIQHCDNVWRGALNWFFGGKEWHFIISRVVKVNTISQAVDSIQIQRMPPKFSVTERLNVVCSSVKDNRMLSRENV